MINTFGALVFQRLIVKAQYERVMFSIKKRCAIYFPSRPLHVLRFSLNKKKTGSLSTTSGVRFLVTHEFSDAIWVFVTILTNIVRRVVWLALI
jgi:hypothetical protein